MKKKVFILSIQLLSLHFAGPLSPQPNMTSIDAGSKEGSCALGDVVYLPGDEFPGSGPCERCRCARGGVRCARTRCEPRPGCKALHRPDHCCPTYQCGTYLPLYGTRSAIGGYFFFHFRLGPHILGREV